MPAGTLIYNQDPDSAIWVSSSTSVSPGNGIRIGALGTVTWTTDGSPVWAILDTGVTTPSTIGLSSDLNNPQNPVDVGIAIAVELAATGVPNVLVEDVLGPFNLPAGGSLVLDVRKYASLIVSTDGSPSVCTNLNFDWWADGTGSLGLGDNWTNPPGIGPGVVNVELQNAGVIEVLGQILHINNFDLVNSIPGLQIIGSNRPAHQHIDTSRQDSEPVLFSSNQAMVAGTAYVMPLVINPGAAVAPKPEGTVYAEFIVSTAAPKGFFSLDYTDSRGLAQSMELADTTEMHTLAGGAQQLIYKLIALPRCGYTINFHCTTAGTATVALKAIKAAS